MAEPADRHQHLRLSRAEPINPRRTGGSGRGPKPPENPAQHGQRLRDALDDLSARPVPEPGFDPRLLLKLEVDGVTPDEFEAIPGLQVVSQEEKTLVVLFATQAGLREFRQRLDVLSRGGKPTRQDVLFAVRGVNGWGPEDRTGPALRQEGAPPTTPVVLDVELWPLERRPDRNRMIDKFEEWCVGAGISVLGKVNQDAIVIVRVRATEQGRGRLLQHRDVRLVDLPPRFQLTEGELKLDIGQLGPISPPPAGAPTIGVLDSGIVSNHPLLAPAVGDAQSFISGFGPADVRGHGTAVSGLALYGDIAACAAGSGFVPRLRLLSGRIVDDQGQNMTGFVEDHIEAAVRYFQENYGCRVFALAVSDERKPYTGGRVRGLAVTLDTLARTRDVLFVVPTGNYKGDATTKWKSDYPNYLRATAARILDPAPALNVLTVGSVARYEKSRAAQRFPENPAFQVAARTGQPSPFTRTGPGLAGAIKPDLVEHGGNLAVNIASGETVQLNALVGEMAPAHDFATTGKMLGDFWGTSYAVPQVAHVAARLLAEYPKMSTNLLRALLVAHAEPPASTRNMGGTVEDLRSLIGHGQPRADRCIYSLENCVSLVAEESLGEDEHHFFEVPLPADFVAPGRRQRAIRVAVAHAPMVRTTRYDYRASRMQFRLVAANSLDEVARVFKKTPREERQDAMKEFRNGGEPGPNVRDKGTVQAARYEVLQMNEADRRKLLVVVVTRIIPQWALGRVPKEPYALVVVLEDRSEGRVRYYQQIVTIQQQLRARARL